MYIKNHENGNKWIFEPKVGETVKSVYDVEFHIVEELENGLLKTSGEEGVAYLRPLFSSIASVDTYEIVIPIPQEEIQRIVNEKVNVPHKVFWNSKIRKLESVQDHPSATRPTPLDEWDMCGFIHPGDEKISFF